MGFSTDAIHGGQEPDPATGAVTVPIYQTSTFVQKAWVNIKALNMPALQILPVLHWRKISRYLEQGFAGFGFSSGMAIDHDCVLFAKIR